VSVFSCREINNMQSNLLALFVNICSNNNDANNSMYVLAIYMHYKSLTCARKLFTMSEVADFDQNSNIEELLI